LTLLRKKKGVSGIISGVFLVALTVMIFGALSWQFFRGDQYNQIMLERQQREWERYNERIAITDTGYSKYLRFKVSNIGGVTAHIVTIYLNDTTSNIPRALTLEDYITSNCSAWISSGSDAWVYTTILLTPNHVYDLKITTERGNMGILLKVKAGGEGPTGNQPVPFVFAFGFNDWQYSLAPGTTPPQEDDQSWAAAWYLKQSMNAWFRIKLKNTSGKDVQLETKTHLNLVNAGKSPLETQANNEAYQTVDVLLGEEKWVVFKRTDLKNIPDQNLPSCFYVFIALYYHPINPTEDSRGAAVTVLSVYITKT